MVVLVLLILTGLSIGVIVDGRVLDKSKRTSEKINNRIAISQEKTGSLVNEWAKMEEAMNGWQSNTSCTNHIYAWKVTTPATCNSNGTKTGTCVVCGIQTTETIVNTGSHSYGTWVQTTAATCTTEGIETKSCTTCGKLSSVTRTIAALGHNFSNSGVCTRCGASRIPSTLAVGDYVNYPVIYTNVTINQQETKAQDIYAGKWRVIAIEGSEASQYIKIVSAGVPLTYYFSQYIPASVEALTTNFLTTTYASSGFTGGISNILNTTYASSVQAMTKEDIDSVVGETITAGTYVNGDIYNNLLAVPNMDSSYAEICLATVATQNSTIWTVSSARKNSRKSVVG